MNFVDTKSTVITGKPDQDKRILRKIWSNAITTQAKLELITRLCNLNLGFRGIEEFCNLQMGYKATLLFGTVNVCQVY